MGTGAGDAGELGSQVDAGGSSEAAAATPDAGADGEVDPDAGSDAVALPDAPPEGDGGPDSSPGEDASDGAPGNGTDGGICEAPAPGATGDDCGYGSIATPVDCSHGAACGRTTGYRCSKTGGVPAASACAAVGTFGLGYVDYCCSTNACARTVGDDTSCGDAGRSAAYWCPGAGAAAPAGHDCTELQAVSGAVLYCCAS